MKAKDNWQEIVEDPVFGPHVHTHARQRHNQAQYVKNSHFQVKTDFIYFRLH